MGDDFVQGKLGNKQLIFTSRKLKSWPTSLLASTSQQVPWFCITILFSLVVLGEAGCAIQSLQRLYSKR